MQILSYQYLQHKKLMLQFLKQYIIKRPRHNMFFYALKNYAKVDYCLS